MNGRKLLVGVAVLSMARASLALAAPAPCAVDAPDVHTRTSPLVRTSHDPATGATIVLRREASGKVTLDLSSNGVAVRKTFDGTSAVTTLSRNGQSLTIALTGGTVAVTAPGRAWSGTLTDTSALDEAAAYLRQSVTAQSAKDLLDRTGLNPNTFEGNALLLTRGLLGSLWSESAAVVEHQRWVAAKVHEPQVTRVRLPGGPAGCWNLYAAEASRIADNLADCFETCSVLRFTCRMSCGFMYEVRAEAAFMWFMSCNGGFFVG